VVAERDEDRLLVERVHRTQRPDLFFMNPDGTDVQRLPMPAALADTDPTWRPATPTQLLPTYLTLGANGSDPVNVSGELFPAHAGATIKVTLSERVGGVYQRSPRGSRCSTPTARTRRRSPTRRPPSASWWRSSSATLTTVRAREY